MLTDKASFTRAAEKLRVSQPAVSAQIRRLERELGEELLDRPERSARTTAVGAAVLPDARAALAAVDGARLAVSELTGLLRGRAALGTVTSPDVDVAGLPAALHDRYPVVEISLALADLAGQPLISLPRGSGLRARPEDTAAAAGIRLRAAVEASSPETVADRAAHGLGVAFLPGPFARYRPDRLAVLQIDPPRRRPPR